MIINTIIIVQKSSNIHVYNLFEIIKTISNFEKIFLPSLAPLRLYALPEPPTTSFAHVYRVHDHHQTQADMVS